MYTNTLGSGAILRVRALNKSQGRAAVQQARAAPHGRQRRRGDRQHRPDRHVGFRGIAHDIAAGHGVLGQTQAAAIEYHPASVRVNGDQPGLIDTPMADRFTGGPEWARTSDLSRVEARWAVRSVPH